MNPMSLETIGIKTSEVLHSALIYAQRLRAYFIYDL